MSALLDPQHSAPTGVDVPQRALHDVPGPLELGVQAHLRTHVRERHVAAPEPVLQRDQDHPRLVLPRLTRLQLDRQSRNHAPIVREPA